MALTPAARASVSAFSSSLHPSVAGAEIQVRNSMVDPATNTEVSPALFKCGKSEFLLNSRSL